MKEKLKSSTLYWVYDRGLALEHDPDGSKLRRAVDSGLIDLLQFRAKEITTAEYEEWVESRLQFVDRTKTIVLANDYAESVQKLGLDGVHVGQNDMPVTLVKKMLGNNYIVGVTSRSPEQAKDAVSHGADYVGAGTVFNTETKKGLVAKGTAYVADLIRDIEITVFPIGGITQDNAKELADAGITRAAVASCLLESDEPEKIALQIRNLLRINTFC
ncbi:MAG: thiamine phosphate synthase [Lentisphaeraceae bacterium]|nr:thiamine phosphate synthase [Lentisphaeraceae bacterium]